MKLTEHLYKLTGVEYDTNSNVYAIRYDDGVVLVDCGFQEKQWDAMVACMGRWGISLEEVTHVLLTHSHFDHAGNVWRVNQLGARVLASAPDAEKVEHGNPEMEALFGATWTCGQVDAILEDGDELQLPGGVRIDVIATPGHSAGSLSFLVDVDGARALCTGDQFFVAPLPPEDDVEIELGYMGSSDASLDDLVSSLERLEAVDFDMLLPGHYYTYAGKDAGRLVSMALGRAREEQQ